MRETELIWLIILAAGRSTRFGSNKLLYRFHDRTLIEHIVRRSVESKADRVVVVIGYEHEKINEVLKDLNCKTVFNSYFEKGQSTSVVAGTKFVKNYSRAIMILPGDLPFVRSKDINKVIEEYNATGSLIVAASCFGKIGHPILIDEEIFDDVLMIKEESFGLKNIVNKYRNDMRLAETKSRGVLIDVDVPSDLSQMEYG